MFRHRVVITLALFGLALLLPREVTAQSQASPERSIPLHAMRPEPASRSLVMLPDGMVRERKDHTVTGLLIGAAVGFAAGWAFYDTLCEAVNNRCSDSRVRTVVIGTGAGASLGALLGTLIR